MVKILRVYRSSAMKGIAALLVALAITPASAQIVRCQDGVFRAASDCPGARKPDGVTNPVTRTPSPAPAAPAYLPGSVGSYVGAIMDRAKPQEPDKADQTPPECKFRYFNYADEKGKVLALNAKQECIRNKALKESGDTKGATYDAYKLWKDNFEMESARRNQAVNRANAANAANANANKPKPRMTCKPDYLGRLQCEE